MTSDIAPASAAEPVCLTTTYECPGCGTAYKPRRRNQRYCSRACQKNATRGPRTADASPSRQYDLRRKRALLEWLNTTYYGTPPADRPYVLRGWMDDARRDRGLLRQVFATPGFFNPPLDDRRRVSFHRCWEYPPVPFIADRYCALTLDCRVWQWVNRAAQEPETGEVDDASRAIGDGQGIAS